MQSNNYGEEKAFILAAQAFYLPVLIIDFSLFFFLYLRDTNFFLGGHLLYKEDDSSISSR